MKKTTKTKTMTKTKTITQAKRALLLIISILLLGGFAWIEADRIRQFITQHTDLSLDLDLGFGSDVKFENIFNADLPSRRIESSTQQDRKVLQLYAALQSQQVKQVLPLLDPSLQQQIQQSPELIQDIFRLMPAEEYDRWQVATRSQSVAPKVGAITTLVYVFDYPLNMIAFTLMFKGHDGTATIMALSVDTLKK